MKLCRYTGCADWKTYRARLFTILAKNKHCSLLYICSISVHCRASGCTPRTPWWLNWAMIVSRHNVWPNPWPAGEESQCHSNVIRRLHQLSLCVCHMILCYFCLIPNISLPVIPFSLCGGVLSKCVLSWSRRCSFYFALNIIIIYFLNSNAVLQTQILFFAKVTQ